MATIRLPPDFKEFLKLLNSEKVEYLVIGGYAVGHHGFVRATADMDVWISTSPEDTERLSRVLIQFGFSAGHVPARMLQEKGKVFRMGLPPTRLEILTSISGVEFADCFARCVVAQWEEVPVNIISLADLRINKKASGRPRISAISPSLRSQAGSTGAEPTDFPSPAGFSAPWSDTSPVKPLSLAEIPFRRSFRTCIRPPRQSPPASWAAAAASGWRRGPSAIGSDDPAAFRPSAL